MRSECESDRAVAWSTPGTIAPAPRTPAPKTPVLTRNLRRFTGLLRFGGRIGLACESIAPGTHPTQPIDRDLSANQVGVRWMRERAHWADSAITRLAERPSSASTFEILRWRSLPGRTWALPNAVQALRTRPHHFALFMALPRKVFRNSCSSRLTSHSRLGCSRHSPVETVRGCKLAVIVVGAFRLKGQTSWQMSQP
jgi:hypothetical protein